jgi:hypothetical protein
MLNPSISVRTRWLAAALAVAGVAFVACSSEPSCTGPAGLCTGVPISVSAGGRGSVAGGMSAGGESGGAAGVDIAAGAGGSSEDAEPSLGRDNNRFDGPGLGGGPAGYCDDAAVTPAPLDLAVTSYFHFPGFYGDSYTELSIVPVPDRAPAAIGDAWGLKWIPAGHDWVGLGFLNADQNWSGPGLCIAAGAAKVQFQARGEQGGEVAKFEVPVPAGKPPVSLTLTLTKDWQTFELDLNGFDYNLQTSAGGVNNGFSVDLTDAALHVQVIYIDDIRWVAEPGGAKCSPPLDLLPACDGASAAPSAAQPSASMLPLDCLPRDAYAPDDAGLPDEAGLPDDAGLPPPSQPAPDNTGAVSAPLLLDDFEDGDALSLPFLNGHAHWETVNDGSARGVQYPGPCVGPRLERGPTAQSRWSLHTYGCGFNLWGAGLSLVFDYDASGCPPFSQYDGIEFWISSPRRATITVEFQTVFGDKWNVQRDLLAGWRLQRIPFVEAQSSSTRPPIVNQLLPVAISAVSWTVRPDVSKPTAAPFDFALDDVAFYADANPAAGQ